MAPYDNHASNSFTDAMLWNKQFDCFLFPNKTLTNLTKLYMAQNAMYIFFLSFPNIRWSATPAILFLGWDEMFIRVKLIFYMGCFVLHLSFCQPKHLTNVNLLLVFNSISFTFFFLIICRRIKKSWQELKANLQTYSTTTFFHFFFSKS